MLGRAVTGAAMACCMAVAAYAADDQADADACIEQLIRAEGMVHAKVEAEALSEAEAEKVYLLLDNADASCTEGSFSKAHEALANARKLLGTDN